MKFNFTKLLCLLLVLCLSCGLFGCATTEEEGNSNADSSATTSTDSTSSTLIGKYMLYAVESSYGNMSYEELVDAGAYGSYVELNSDNTFTLFYSDSNSTIKGTYDAAANTLTAEGSTVSFVIDGDLFYLGEKGNATVFTKGELPQVDVPEIITDKGEPIDATAVITVKDYGTITVQLSYEDAPVTVTNFVKLAREGFYNGLTFHRIIKGFMIQGGCPKGNGTGGADKNIFGEFTANGHENDLSHKRGVISMARSQNYNSASSQFFICDADSSHLDGQYAAFGWVVTGMDVVDAIAAAAKPSDNNGTIPAADQPVIESIVIIEK